MSSEQTSEQRAQQRLKAEVDAFDVDKVAQAQAQLDHWWQGELNLKNEHRAMMARLNEFGLKIW